MADTAEQNKVTGAATHRKPAKRGTSADPKNKSRLAANAGENIKEKQVMTYPIHLNRSLCSGVKACESAQDAVL